MSRNTSGTYALPTGNPVQSGTVIASTWANETLGDLGAEMTDSLNRSGKGGMLAPLKVDTGTAAAPAVTWAADPDSGLYRAGVNSVGMSAGATQIQRWETTGTAISVSLTVTTPALNTIGVVAVGNGTGAGISTTGGASGNGVTALGGGAGSGISATGGASGAGVTALGGGSAAGISATGGATGAGGSFSGGATGGNGITATATGTANSGGIFIGAASGLGVEARAGTAATATTSQIAMRSKDGYLQFDAVNPNSNVAFTNMVTPANVAKVRALLTKASGGGVVITTGFNVASVSFGTTTATLTFASAFANTNYEVQVTCGGGAPWSFTTNVTSTTTVELKARNLASGALPLSEIDFSAASGTDVPIYVTIFGAQ